MAPRPLWRAVIPCAVVAGALLSAPAANAATEHEAEDATISQGLVESNLKIRATAVTADGTATTTTVAGLTTGTAYRFKIRARDAAGNISGFGNEITVTPSVGGPSGVPNPGAVTTLAGGVDVAWGVAFLPDGSALFAERNSFNIYRLTEGGQRTLGLAQRLDHHQRPRVRGDNGRAARVYRMRIDANSSLVEQSQYFQGTYNRLRTVEVDQQGDIWLTTSTDKDGVANNDRILHIDIVYSGG